jgi:hypothetical protein
MPDFSSVLDRFRDVFGSSPAPPPMPLNRESAYAPSKQYLPWIVGGVGVTALVMLLSQ